MNQPLVSIIVPCYNGTKYLKECLDSLVAQTYPNIEIIVVDDASQDNPKEITDQYPQIKYIRNEVNKHLSGTMNVGLVAAKGDWLMECDHDDKLEKDYVKLCLEWAEAKQVDIVGSYQQEFQDRHEVHHFHPNPAHEDFLNGNKINCSSLYSRKVYKAMLEKYGYFYDERLRLGYMDWQGWLRATKLGFKVATLPLPLFFYRIHKDSMIAGLIKKDLRNDTFEEMKDSIPEIFA